MNSARLREERIEIYRRGLVHTEYGSYEEQLTYITWARAGVLNQTENKIFLNDELQFPQTRKFLVRHYVDVKENDVIKWNDMDWNVDSVMLNRYYFNKEIECSKINP